jgi:Cu(I)/Ag(I) efflux system membrane protein CusA/SilA
VIARVVAWSGRRSGLVIAAAAVIAAGAFASARGVSRDVIPDLSDPQVVLVAEWMGHPAAEVATRIATPLTQALETVPGATAVRASSMSGMAYVDVSFGSASAAGSGREAIAARV